ncbi:hypothetical protein RCH12_002787 [Cryobacterium sp. MP_3.1]|nr:hypothetical protein [Cryobacterium sp. MP_3.1]
MKHVPPMWFQRLAMPFLDIQLHILRRLTALIR